MANSQTEMTEWLTKIQFHAVLPPSQQLMNYDPDVAVRLPSPTHSASSHASAPDPVSPVLAQHAPPPQFSAAPSSPASSHDSDRVSHSPPAVPPPIPASHPRQDPISEEPQQSPRSSEPEEKTSPRDHPIKVEERQSPRGSEKRHKGRKTSITSTGSSHSSSKDTSHSSHGHREDENRNVPPPQLDRPPSYRSQPVPTPRKVETTPSRHTMAPSDLRQTPYHNGEGHRYDQPPSGATVNPGAQTLPPGTAPPTYDLSRSGSLDRSAQASMKGDKSDKKRHSMFSGLFKKKKDKEK